MTLGSIKLDTSKPKATMATGGKQVHITGLKYTYGECVDPSSVTFEAFQQNHLGYCDMDKSLSAVAKFTGTPGIGAVDMTLTLNPKPENPKPSKPNLNSGNRCRGHDSDD